MELKIYFEIIVAKKHSFIYSVLFLFSFFHFFPLVVILESYHICAQRRCDSTWGLILEDV